MIQLRRVKRTYVTPRKSETDIKTRGVSIFFDEFAGVFRMLRKWCPAHSERDSVPGFFRELRELRELVITMLREKYEGLKPFV